MNKVILMGRLTRDPEVRWTTGDNAQAVARYTLAVDRRGRRDAETTADFINCVAFGKSAEFAEKYLRQGTKMVIEGRIQTGRYTKQDGSTVYTTNVVVEGQEFAESKASQGAAPTTAQAPTQPAPAPMESNGSDFMSIPDGIDEELPFQ
ncbi:MAG: single-stranded DNA-binding protein [Eubacterium sp.]|nr:single-stranded DNA-binding protein [Eubacterium sp.]